MAKHEMWELQQMQALPLKLKIRLTQQRIREWVNEFGLEGVYVSFSGGKDSTVLLHIARQMYPEIKAVFSNTGLEFPETVSFVKTFDNVDFVQPKMSYMSVIKKYGYPLISKEVSECVWGARKYLNSVIEEEMKNVKREEQKCIYCGDLLGKKGCLGMCNKHYIQYKRWGDPLHADNKERATIDGYYRDGKTGRREHRVIWEEYYGEKLEKDEIIHHINFVKTDNRIENLYKYANASEHIKAHRQFERLMDALSDDEEIFFEDGEYRKRERDSFRQTAQNLRISGISRNIVSCADAASMNNLTRGGTTTSTANSEESETTLPVRMAETQRNWWIWRTVQQCQKAGLGGGGEVRLFAKTTGILTSDNVIDKRLYKNYRQFESPTSNGDKQSERQSDDGEYP